jgi:hypothetical protein
LRTFLFSWFWMISACFIMLLCTRKRREFANLQAYCELMCALESCQWCREPCFAGAAISTDRFLPQIPRRDRHKPSSSYIATDGQSASLPWYMAPFGANDQILNFFEWL